MRAIITYHSLDSSGSPISLTPTSFKRHVDWLSAGKVHVMGVKELTALSDEVDAVALTFDDGFTNIAEEALPLLHDRGFPATVFIVTGHVGGDNRWRGRDDPGIPVLPLLDWDRLGRIRESGVILAAHTRTHPILTELGATALEDELWQAADEMQKRLGERPEGFAYPYGAMDTRVASATERCYGWACTTELRSLCVQDSLFRLPRLDAGYFSGPTGLARWGEPEFRARIWYRRQLRRARSAARRLRHA